MALHSALASPLPRDSGAPIANGEYLFEMIVADLHWSSLQIATLCMMAAACAAPGTPFSLRTCRHIVYDDARVMRLALRYSEGVGLGAEARQRLDRLYGDLAVMQKQILPFVDPPKLSPLQRDQLQRLLPPFRKIAVAAADAIGALSVASRQRLPASYAYDGVTIQQFLGRAARGDLDEIDSFGVLSTPPLRQRRHSPRVPTNFPCRLALAQGDVEATIVDVSRQGLGVVCQATLRENQEVAVLVGERRLEGVVARVQGRQIGLTLRKRLTFTDPLFQA